jgi:predicted acetyltransferase
MPSPSATPANLVISKIGPESDALLRNLAEHYCYDMSEWFDLNIGANGRYSYDTAPVWAKGHDAYLVKVDDSIAGFALIGLANEWLDDLGAHDVREFFILRKFRRRSFGRIMARFLWNEYPGEWLVRVLEANAPAATFWRREISAYSVGSYGETEHVISGRRWKFFRFISNQAKPESLMS